MTADDADLMPRSQRDAPCIRLDAGRRASRHAARLLEALGAHRSLAEEGIVYLFPTRDARDCALDRVRREYGWMIAMALDDRRDAAGGPPPGGRTLDGSGPVHDVAAVGLSDF